MFFARSQPTLIAPSQVGASIVKLVENSRERLILISPFFKPWEHLKRALEDAVARGVEIKLIIRSEEIAAARQYITPLQIDAHHIERLHAKLYLSEQSAIMTSMNLYDGSRDSWETGLLISATAKLYPTLMGHAQEQFVAKSSSIDKSELIKETPRTAYLEQTHYETLTLLQRGLTDEQIATERELKVSTVHSHFEAIAAARRHPINELVDPARVRAIQKALDACGVDSALRDIKAYLSQDTPMEYWEIAAVRNFEGDGAK
jgi:hypothetical protein